MMLQLFLIKQMVRPIGAHKILVEHSQVQPAFGQHYINHETWYQCDFVRELGVSRIIDIADRFGFGYNKITARSFDFTGYSITDTS